MCHVKQSDSLYDKLLSSIDKSFSVFEKMKLTGGSVDLSSQCDGDQAKAEHDDISQRADTSSPDCESHSQTSNWHIYDNPLLSLCDISEINSRGPPLFALKIPDLFVFG